MPLQSGQWQLNMNGTQGTLTINSVDAPGLVTGALTYGRGAGDTYPIIGRWDEAGKRLVFHTATTNLPPLTELFSLAFTGYLFRDAMRMPGLRGDVVYTLVGHYLAFSDAGTTDQHEFGWYAQIGLA
jgi:hypothetical protein